MANTDFTKEIAQVATYLIDAALLYAWTTVVDSSLSFLHIHDLKWSAWVLVNK